MEIRRSNLSKSETKYRVVIEGGGTIEISKKADMDLGGNLSAKIDLKLNLSDFDFSHLTNHSKFTALNSVVNEEITNFPQITGNIEQWIDNNSVGLLGHQASMSMIMVLHNFVRPRFVDDSTADTFKISEKTNFRLLRNTKVYHFVSNCPLPIEKVVISWKEILNNNMVTYEKLLNDPLSELNQCTSIKFDSKIQLMLEQEVLAKIMRVCVVLFPSATPPEKDLSNISPHASESWDLYRPQDKLHKLHDIYDEVLLEADKTITEKLRELSGGKMRTIETSRNNSIGEELNFIDLEKK